MSLGIDLRALAQQVFYLSVVARLRSRSREPRRGICAFCGEAGDDLVLDHDHETGRNRGLVHQACNAAIGPHTKANVQRLLDYLNRQDELGTYPDLRDEREVAR